jgi:hypothetical protein
MIHWGFDGRPLARVTTEKVPTALVGSLEAARDETVIVARVLTNQSTR